jgi:hypothetical protein
MLLSFPRLKIFYEGAAGEEVEVHKGHVVEAEGRQVMLKAKRVVQELSFKVGDRVQITAEDFFQIGFGCWLFANDLAAKLPKMGNA